MTDRWHAASLGKGDLEYLARAIGVADAVTVLVSDRIMEHLSDMHIGLASQFSVQRADPRDRS